MIADRREEVEPRIKARNKAQARIKSIVVRSRERWRGYVVLVGAEELDNILERPAIHPGDARPFLGLRKKRCSQSRARGANKVPHCDLRGSRWSIKNDSANQPRHNRTRSVIG